MNPPSLSFRLTALLGCPAWLVAVSFGISALTRRPLALTLAVVLLGATAVMLLLGALALRLYRHQENAGRFRLSTLLLIVVLASIYLAGLRWLAVGLPWSDLVMLPSIPPAMALVLFLTFMVMAILTTAALLAFAEAVVWLAVTLLRRRGFRRRQSSKPSG